MSNIITPKEILKKGQKTWLSKNDKKRNTQPTKMERTGDTTFNIHHEDGSIFECKADPTKVKLASDSRKTANRFYISDDLKARNVMSNADRRRMGIPEDPDLEK